MSGVFSRLLCYAHGIAGARTTTPTTTTTTTHNIDNNNGNNCHRQRGNNPVYNVLPDIVGHLSKDEQLAPAEYRQIMGESI